MPCVTGSKPSRVVSPASRRNASNVHVDFPVLENISLSP